MASMPINKVGSIGGPSEQTGGRRLHIPTQNSASQLFPFWALPAIFLPSPPPTAKKLSSRLRKKKPITDCQVLSYKDDRR